jgi:predicted RNA-binding protein with PUA-like domain
MPNYWLFKKEPKNISMSDIENAGRLSWTGVRNYQARNYLRDTAQEGDMVLVYHSNSDPSGVVGIAKIYGNPYPDLTAQDPTTNHYDPAATPEKPIWAGRDVEFVETFPHIVSLAEIRANPSLLNMLVIRRGMRLSIQPVDENDFKQILALARSPLP